MTLGAARAAAQPGDGRAAAAGGARPGRRSSRGDDEPRDADPGEVEAAQARAGGPRARCSRASTRATARSSRSARRSTSPTSSCGRWSCCATPRRVAAQLARALRARHRRRVPGHQPRAARARRVLCAARDPRVHGRRRAPVDLPLPKRRPRGLPRPSGRRAGERPRHARCCRCAATSARRRRSSRRVNAVGAALLDGFARAHRPAESDGGAGAGGAAAHPRGGAAARTPSSGSRRRSSSSRPPESSTPHVVAEARSLAERLRELVDAGEAQPRRDRRPAARLHPRRRLRARRWPRAGLDPYVVGGRGYWSQQQVEDLIRLLGVVANPLDDELLFGALACPAVAVSPDALWLLRQARRREQPPRLAGARGPLRRAATRARPTRARSGSTTIDAGDDASASRRFCAHPREPARRRAAADAWRT